MSTKKSEPEGAVVVVVSTSAAAGDTTDTTGPLITQWLSARGFEIARKQVISDGPDVGATVCRAIAEGVRVVIVTGGTGVTATDRTPEQVAPLIDLEVPGIIEEIRRRGSTHVPTAILTRGVAGFAGNTFVVTLPGSSGGVRDGLAVLDQVLDHMLDQQSRGSRH